MKIILTAAICLILSTVNAQYNFAALDSLFKASQPSIQGVGGGVSVMLIKDGKTIYDKSFGNFGINKAVPIASASKWYAGVLIMTLVDEGKLSLQDKVSKYIASFKGEKEDLTIGQCFSLTGGFAGTSEVLDEFMSNRNQTYAEMVDEIAKQPLKAKPGDQFNYGGLSMQVAGRVAEIATGKSWNVLFKEKVTEPLGLTKTFYSSALVGAVPRIAGGVVSCGADYLKLLTMIMNNGVYNGKRILSAKAVKVMLTDQTGNATIGYSPFTKFKGNMKTTKEPRYGIGNWVIDDIGGITINTSPGAFGFTPWIDKAHGYCGVIALRGAFAKVMPVFWKAVHIINAELDRR